MIKFSKEEISLAYKDKNWLQQKYTKEKLNIRRVAKLANVSSSTISDYLRKFNIERRKGWALKKSSQECGYAHAHFEAKRIWEEWWRQEVPEGYLVHHVDRNWRNNEISNLALVTRSYHTKIHTTDESRRKMRLARIGNKNPNWKDGRSYEIYPHRLKAVLAVLEEGT